VTTVPLPDDPSLEQLRKLAKDIRDLSRAGEPGVLDLIGRHHPDGAAPVSLAGAQLVVARHHGFASWSELKHHVELIQRYRRAPDELDADSASSVADRFLLLACLRYGDDDSPSRWQQAAELLRAHPYLTTESIHVAAAAADVQALEGLLADDPARARAQGGPYRWEPILYLVFARHAPDLNEAATITAARLLLEAGADPNAGYLWHGLTTPFTALTGALGAGEGEQPAHPHGLALARLLLSAGADANDGQTLYNRQFHTDDSHLELLFEFGLGQGDGGSWRARLGRAVDSPYHLVRGQLWWAVVHDMVDRVRLLVRHGADILTPYEAPGGRPSGLRTSHGRTPAEVASICGCPRVLDFLLSVGATPPAGEGVDGLVAAILAGDTDTVRRLRVHAEQARAERPGLAVWAAARRRWDAIPILKGLGFDVNALARADIPMEQQWESALHQAAASGDCDAVQMLLDVGADPNQRDRRFNSTPLGWAEHFGQAQTAEMLRPLTTDA